MGRILAIDYGRRRVGLAVTDILQIVPNGLTTVRACDALDYITRYVAAEDVEQIIIGLPRQMSGEYSDSMTYIRPFVKKLKAAVTTPIAFVDERFTSILAQHAMTEAGLKNKIRKDKGMVDEISATIILQSYMDNRAAATDTI